MKAVLLLMFLSCAVISTKAQATYVAPSLQPHLQEFLKTCDKYGIQYQDKLAQLARIEIVNTLPISQYNTTLGMLKRNQQNKVVGIEINWMAQIDPTILKIVSFHEFAHYFLEYEGHPCDDCLHIMGARNTNYFEIAQQWEAKLNQLFNESPAFLNKHNSLIGMGSN